MANHAGIFDTKQLVRAVLFGAASLVLYLCLFFFERDILALSALGGWHFLIPVGIAFVFSFAHGTFTGHFWDALGVRAKR